VKLAHSLSRLPSGSILEGHCRQEIENTIRLHTEFRENDRFLVLEFSEGECGRSHKESLNGWDLWDWPSNCLIVPDSQRAEDQIRVETPTGIDDLALIPPCELA
jgi:hypothetical protein